VSQIASKPTTMAQSGLTDISFQLTINDRIQRTTTLGTVVPIPLEPEDKDPDELCWGKDYCDLRELLKLCQISHTDGNRKFWPDQLLQRIVSQERVEKELRRFVSDENSDPNLPTHSISWYLQKIFPEEVSSSDIMNGARNGIDSSESSKQRSCARYIKIYTILVLCEQQPFIVDFIENGIHDDYLPFGQHNKYPSMDIPCFRSWKASQIDQFLDFQYQVLIPYFCFAPGPTALPTVVKHLKYYDRVIMPWIREEADKLERGGYGIVSCMRMHPASHGFHTLAQVRVGKGMFALKKITSKDIKDFENETKMLGIFSGHHDHLIMLLTSFNWNGHNYLLFPWADCDLENYWNSKAPPYDAQTGLMNPTRMTWVSKQLVGLTSGLHNIHNPKHLHSKLDMRFGRHGDLKPDNILWLKPEDDRPDDDGILVIGDLGISAIHREASRSNQPGKKIPRSPNYRPPECDLEGGTISRAFDVWTLGCLFLEMICWTLGGTQLVKQFTDARTRVPYLGSMANTNIFFDIKKTEDGGHVILVKDAVLSVSIMHLVCAQSNTYEH
jgi:hypothetical protein